MKILAIGDFHGKFPGKLKQRVKKEKIDLILSTGDFTPFSYRKIWFKHCYKTDIELWEVIGKKKYKDFILKDNNQARKLLKKLDKLNIKIISVTGNIDKTGWVDAHRDYDNKPASRWKWRNLNHFAKLSQNLKNFKFVDFSYFKFGNLIFIGYPSSTFPGHVKSKKYREYKKRLEKLFNKFRRENKGRRVIFISHNVPYNTKLDKITDRDADKQVKGKHYGSKLTKRLIKKYQPVLHIGGHMHENQGKCKIRKTVSLNPGAAADGKASIIELDDKNRKIKSVKFIR